MLITNQVTYNPQLKETLPALGKQWQSVCSTNLMLERDSNDLINIRKGKILKSPTLCEDTQFEFVVCVSIIHVFILSFNTTKFKE